MSAIEIGLMYRFAYPIEFTILSDYLEHCGELVRVVREADDTESDHHADPELPILYFIEAADGWTGYADETELEPLS